MIAYGGYFYFAPDAADNFLERELGMKRGVSGEGLYFPYQFPSMVAKLGKLSVYGVNDKSFFTCLKCIGQLSSHIENP